MGASKLFFLPPVCPFYCCCYGLPETQSQIFLERSSKPVTSSLYNVHSLVQYPENEREQSPVHSQDPDRPFPVQGPQVWRRMSGCHARVGSSPLPSLGFPTGQPLAMRTQPGEGQRATQKTHWISECSVCTTTDKPGVHTPVTGV